MDSTSLTDVFAGDALDVLEAVDCGKTSVPVAIIFKITADIASVEHSHFELPNPNNPIGAY